ncbi:MAG TPA: sugar ABC transporter ATP-binding protein [Desulfitobacteriaceae bacterium]|nr:sugar ABC transporter ATP-binding protein [Desulfitobacteriaceae bacterium]
MDNVQPLLEVHNISKAFSGIKVIDNVNIQVFPGEIVALLGENGAGKSTLKNVLVGLLEPEEGTIIFKGQERKKMKVGAYKIAAVHQELSVFPSLTVAENICITNLPGNKPMIDWKKCRETAKKYLELIGVELDLDTTVEILSPGENQLVEIAKSLRQQPDLLILDEPTTSLSHPERQKLFGVMRMLAKQGVGIIFITHFIDEVYEISDKIIVLRNGVHVGGGLTKETPRKEVEQLLVGRSLLERKLEIPTPIEKIALKVSDFNSDRFIDINFEVKQGEILGIAGLMGAGRTEIIESIFGLRKTRGTLECLGKTFKKWNPTMLRDMGVLFVPEDRKTNGIFPQRALRENLTAANLKKMINPVILGIGFRNEKKNALELAKAQSLVFSNIETSITSLSGGNQQKAIIARWLAIDPKVCIFDDPTRGVDIGAKEAISAQIAELARNGCAVLLVSSDVNELTELSHRILILRKGRIVSELKRSEFDAQKIISIASTGA